MPTAIRRLLPAAELFVLIALCALFVVRGLVPGWRSLISDFGNYYTVARLLSNHYALDRIYDWIWLQRVKDHWSIQQPLVGFAGLTPFSALPMVPLAWMDALDAKRVWLVLNLGVLAASLYGLQKINGMGMRRVVLIAFLAIIPLRNNFLLGQMHVVVLGLLVLAYWLDTRKRWFSCGLVLAFAASLKVYPLFFVFYFLRKRQWKPAAVLAGSTLGLLALCLFLFGEPAMRVFLIEQFPRMLRGEVTDPFSLTAPSASSLFHRLFLTQPLVNPQPLLSSPMLYALLYPLWQLCLLGATLLAISSQDVDPRRRSLEWAAFTCLLLALSTEPSSYHRVVLIFVAVLAVDAIKGVWYRAILLGCYVATCNLHPAVSAQHLIRALSIDFLPFWALVGMLACLLAGLRAATSMSWAARSGWRRWKIAMALAGFAAIWCAASATTLAHTRSLAGPQYLADRAGRSFARFAPHPAGKHTMTVAMGWQGYRVEDEEGGGVQTGPPGVEEDQLAIGSSRDVNRYWIESVSGGVSRLVELPVSSSSASIAPIATILNAEAPALSPDGRSLVFLREVNGAGRAWMVHLDESGLILDAPLPVTPEKMNVWDAVIAAPGVILFSAAQDGTPHLFVTYSGEPPRRIYAVGDAMDSSTVNPANGLLVYRQRNGSYWHLFGAGLLPNSVTQLTFGDCNAYGPAWSDPVTLLYISDCGRGMGLGAVAISHPSIVPKKPDHSLTSAFLADRPQGEAQR
ncbi:MAG: glycosyltransferase family 87 protein [Terracidiphilus sp.]